MTITGSNAWKPNRNGKSEKLKTLVDPTCKDGAANGEFEFTCEHELCPRLGVFNICTQTDHRQIAHGCMLHFLESHDQYTIVVGVWVLDAINSNSRT